MSDLKTKNIADLQRSTQFHLEKNAKHPLHIGFSHNPRVNRGELSLEEQKEILRSEFAGVKNNFLIVRLICSADGEFLGESEYALVRTDEKIKEITFAQLLKETYG